MLSTQEAITGGFANPVLDAQTGFKTLMDCMARPGTVHAPDVCLAQPAPLNRMAALAALTLFDSDTPFWLDDPLHTDSIRDWIGFHTGATPAREKGTAHFAILQATDTMADLAEFNTGTQEYPDRSATLILQVEGFAADPAWLLRGPGIDGSLAFEPLGMPRDFLWFWDGNRNRFPCGIDIVFAAPQALAALPRNTRIDIPGSSNEVS